MFVGQSSELAVRQGGVLPPSVSAPYNVTQDSGGHAHIPSGNPGLSNWNGSPHGDRGRKARELARTLLPSSHYCTKDQRMLLLLSNGAQGPAAVRI